MRVVGGEVCTLRSLIVIAMAEGEVSFAEEVDVDISEFSDIVGSL